MGTGGGEELDRRRGEELDAWIGGELNGDRRRGEELDQGELGGQEQRLPKPPPYGSILSFLE
jgi:hypothetical protein